MQVFSHQLSPNAHLTIDQRWTPTDALRWPGAHLSDPIELVIMDHDLDDWEPTLYFSCSSIMEALSEAASLINDYPALKAEFLKELSECD